MQRLKFKYHLFIAVVFAQQLDTRYKRWLDWHREGNRRRGLRIHLTTQISPPRRSELVARQPEPWKRLAMLAIGNWLKAFNFNEFHTYNFLQIIDQVPTEDVRKHIVLMSKRAQDEDDKVCLMQILSLLNNLEALSQDQCITGDDLHSLDIHVVNLF